MILAYVQEHQQIRIGTITVKSTGQTYYLAVNLHYIPLNFNYEHTYLQHGNVEISIPIFRLY
jgi:hypothetical protein